MNNIQDRAVVKTSPGHDSNIQDRPTDLNTLFEQYKLAVEMADSMSTKRQGANNFFIGLISSFGVLYSLFDKASPPPSYTRAWEYVLPIFAVCWCAVWWFTLRAHRRLNKIKWKVIEEELEPRLPADPFASESRHLGKRSFTLTRLELAIPIIVGLVFLFLVIRPFT